MTMLEEKQYHLKMALATVAVLQPGTLNAANTVHAAEFLLDAPSLPEVVANFARAALDTHAEVYA